MLYLIVVLIYSLIVKTTAPYEEEELNDKLLSDDIGFQLLTIGDPFQSNYQY